MVDAKKAGEDLDALLCQRSKLNPNPAPAKPAPPPPPPKPQPPKPKPAGMCAVAAVASAGAGPGNMAFGGGNFSLAWDGDVFTFFDLSKPNGGWTEAKLAAPATITHIEFYPRAGFLNRHVQGGRFVGVKADGIEVHLSAIPKAPTLSWNALAVPAAAGVSSVKYYGADGSFGNIAEIMLFRKC
jgi:hypothetical protein